MKQLLYFNEAEVTKESSQNIPGMKRFSAFFKLFVSATVPIDRTGTLSIPLHTKSLFPIPLFREFKRTYEDICNARAAEILARADHLNVPLYVFWSGGIDSTLVLVSLLKHAGPAQKKNMTVLLSEESIVENPKFYEHDVRTHLKRESSLRFPHILGTPALFVSGELNDQLFGAEMSGAMMRRFGNAFPHKPFDIDQFATFFSERLGGAPDATWYVQLLRRLAESSPIKLTTNHDMIWWFNFAAHWQGVFMRTLLFTNSRNTPLISQNYIDTFYVPFFGTDEFQLWSMNNLDKKIKDSWRTYKWPAKDIIYNYTKDAEYRDNKTKRGSLFSILYNTAANNFVDDSWHFSKELDISEYINPTNDFV